MLDKIKLALRITSNAFDEELKDLTEACENDLRLSGICNVSKNDPLIRQAMKLYCKAYFGDGDEKNKFMNAYTALKISLSLSQDYRMEFDGYE